MAGIPITNVDVGGNLPAGPTIEPGMVQEKGVQSRMTAAPDLGLGSMDKAFATFFGGLSAASGAASDAALEQQNATQTAKLDATVIAGKKQDDLLGKQAEADAENGKPADPAANAFRAYQTTYATYKGANAGITAAQDFVHTVLPTLGANSNFDQAVTDYVKNNHFDTGDAFYDGAAAASFRHSILSYRQNFQGDQVKATIQDGVQQLSSTIGQKTVDGTLTSDDLQTGIASYKKLNPLDASNAGPKVMQAAMGAAKTVPQMTNLLARLNEPNSFAPGVSYAQQFPDTYAEMNDRFGRLSAETTTLEGTQAYEAIEQRLEDAKINGDSKALTQIQADANQVYSQYGGSARHDAIIRQLTPALHSLAVQTATFNQLDQGVGNPAVRDPKLFAEKGDAYFKARGIDPLNSTSSNPAILSGTEAAARTVVAYNTIPSDTKAKMSSAMNNGSAPVQQEAAFNFYHQIAGSVGEANVLTLMNPEAQQTYQTIRDLSAGGANIQGILGALATNGKSELKEVPETTIANQTDPAQAKVTINTAITTAVNNAWNTNGHMLLNPITGATAATISPEVNARIAAQIKTGAMAMANMGPMDINVLAKQAVEREMPNMQTLPGTDGRPIVAYVPGMPSSVPDPANPGKTVPVVQMGRAVMNPVTKLPEDTTNTAISDLQTLSRHMPDRFGTGGGLSLSAALGSYANDLTKATGVYTVLEGGLAGSPGQPVVFDGKTPITLTIPSKGSPTTPPVMSDAGSVQVPAPVPTTPTTRQVTLGSDPVTASKQLSDLWPDAPFVLVKHDTPQGPAYTLGYRPRFTGTLPTIDQRQAAFKAGDVMTQDNTGLPPVSGDGAVASNPTSRAAPPPVGKPGSGQTLTDPKNTDQQAQQTPQPKSGGPKLAPMSLGPVTKEVRISNGNGYSTMISPNGSTRVVKDVP